MKKVLFFILVLFGLSAKAVATTYYVDGASGSDGNAGTSTGAAWKTLAKASTSTTVGDVIYVKASATYNEILTFRSTGTASSPIIWEGYSSTPGDLGRATVEGGNTRASNVRINNCSNNVVKNFILQGATSEAINYADAISNGFFFNCRILKGTGTSPASVSSPGYAAFALTIVGSEISGFTGAGTGTGSGIVLRRIEYCEIHGNSGDGVSAASYRTAGEIQNNLIYSNGGKGISLSGSGGLGIISNNDIHSNTSDGISIDGADNSNVIIQNNVITSNGGYGINIVNVPSGTTFINSDKNFFYSNTSGEISSTSRLIQLNPNVTLTGNPYTSSGTGDYSLNNTAGAGSSVRSAHPYNSFPAGVTVGYLDGGAVQKSGGSTAATVMTISVGGF